MGLLLALIFSLSLLLHQCSVMWAAMNFQFQLHQQSITEKPFTGMYGRIAYQKKGKLLSEKRPLQRNRFADRLRDYKSYRRIMGKRGQEPTTAEENNKWQK